MDYQKPISTFLGIATAAVLATNSHAADIHVPGDQPTIQAGIDAAINGDVVIVAEGEYFEHINFNAKAITVRSTDPNDAGVVLNTVIDGLGLVTVVTCNSGEGPGTVLKGFTITNGFAKVGGGMFNFLSSPTVIGCDFINNPAEFGGGFSSNVASAPTILNCRFLGNTAVQGGGVYVSSSSAPLLANCSFGGNDASEGGAIIVCGGDSGLRSLQWLPPPGKRANVSSKPLACGLVSFSSPRCHLPAM